MASHKDQMKQKPTKRLRRIDYMPINPMRIVPSRDPDVDIDKIVIPQEYKKSWIQQTDEEARKKVQGVRLAK